ncbi:hypothetical protein [Amycolatopsis thermophila]|uniref:Uncharacterized protein n=1 Tax=Amycolatopsis thermophila TaxID=206084 RepID=A0ABU0EMQ8_9PSEU|nr:hypothetical protein [Amycolatopsis thermophila]MDQ0376479.1 hypothetical protein [Amycolatopsis thermophila]
MNESARTKFVKPPARAAKSTTHRWVAGVGVVVAAVSIVASFLRGENADAKVDQLQGAYQSLAVDTQLLVEQVRQLGAQPVVQPPASTEAPVAVPDAPAGPDLDTVRAVAKSAVLDYCGQASQPCRGANGESPNIDALVDLVVAKVPVPKDGRDGEDAPPITDDQMYATFVAYCTQPSEPCRGAAGAPGRDGPACPEGYQLVDAVIEAADGSTYQGKACVDPATSQAPSTDPPTESSTPSSRAARSNE